MSSIKSSLASSPTESLISPSPIPARSRSSGGIPECEVSAGRVIRLSTPPRLGALIGSVNRSRKRSAASDAAFEFEAEHAAEAVEEADNGN